MSLIHLTLSPSYVSTWATWEAIREIIQNAIDTKDYNLTASKENDLTTLSVFSSGGVLEKRTLLLGETSKRDDDNSIGTYGEGFKLAMLVLLRQGKEVFIKNGKDLWTPSFTNHPILETECLTVEISDNEYPDATQSVEFVIKGLTKAEIEEIESKVLEKDFYEYISENGYDDEYDATSKGHYNGSCYWRDENPRLFVGGLFVCDLEKEYELSYNFTPNLLELDRDRHSVSTFYVSLEATKLIGYSGNTALLAELASSNAKDVSDYVNMSRKDGYYGYSGKSEVIAKKVKEDVSAKFVKSYGENAYPMDKQWDNKRTKVETKRAIDAGLTPVSLNHGFYQMLDEELTTKKIGSYKEFNLSAAIREFYEENKTQLRGKPKRALEQIIDTMNLYDGNMPMPEDLKKHVIVDEDSIPF